VIWYWEAGRRPGIYDIRQLLAFADSLRMPRPVLLPVILGQPDALSGLLAGPAATALTASAVAAMGDRPGASPRAGYFTGPAYAPRHSPGGIRCPPAPQ
jgi:hypothetical protein